LKDDIQENSLTIQNPKSGRAEETVYVPRKILVRLSEYIKVNSFTTHDRIFPISYVAAWSMVKKSGQLLTLNYDLMISGDMLQRMLPDLVHLLRLSVK